MADPVILHCDLNNFYASVECLYHPEWNEIPIAVCGSLKDRHGIVLAKNELAKLYGVKTAETIWQAKQKCPVLQVVPPHMQEYRFFSRKAREIYRRYTDQIEPFGIDECWLDVTGSRLLFGTGEQIAQQLRACMKRELGLTISAGVSFTKMFAKLGSDYRKPDAVTCIHRENYRRIVWPLPVSEMVGIGPATSSRLQKYGIHTIGDLARSDEAFLCRILGKHGDGLWRSANGMDSAHIPPEYQSERVKSVGHSVTWPVDLRTEEEVWPIFLRLADDVRDRLSAQSLLAGSVQITVKDNAFHTTEIQGAFSYPTRRSKELASLAMTLFQTRYRIKRPIRMLGLRAISLVGEDGIPACHLLYNPAKQEQLDALEEQMMAIQKKFGKQMICRARLLPPSR